MTVSIPTLPDLEWTGAASTAAFDDGVLTLVSEPGVDWTNSSLGGPQQQAASALAFPAPESFSLSARVSVDAPRSTFDAAALAIWVDADHWAKLCFEFSPQGEAMTVSVITNGYSDDANHRVIDGPAVWMRVSRVGPAWVFHSSTDGRKWDFVRVFRLYAEGPVSVGFLAQAPTGGPCTARFDEIRLGDAPSDLRDYS